MPDAAEFGSNDDLGLTGNWYRPWWKWAIVIALLLLNPPVPATAPSTTAGAVGSLLGALLTPILLVLFGTILARAVKKFVSELRHSSAPDQQ
jgi:hypothetical protein